MRTHIEHTVMFLLDADEGPIVPGASHNQYFRMDGVTVHLSANRPPRVWAGGLRCKKDGGASTAWGRFSMTVECPDPDKWIERARAAVQKAKPDTWG
jgi:hypothetical protein